MGDGVRRELAALRGVKISVAFVFNGDFEPIDHLVRELQDRTDVKLVYVKTSVGRLRIQAEADP
jgi:hypothetical protein